MEINFLVSNLSQHEKTIFLKACVMLDFSSSAIFGAFFSSYIKNSTNSDYDILCAIDNFYDCVEIFSSILQFFSHKYKEDYHADTTL